MQTIIFTSEVFGLEVEVSAEVHEADRRDLHPEAYAYVIGVTHKCDLMELPDDIYDWLEVEALKAATVQAREYDEGRL